MGGDSRPPASGRCIVTRTLALACVIALGCGPKPTDRTGPGGGEPTGIDDSPDEPGQEDEAAAAVQKAINEYRGAVHTCWAIGAADDLNLAGQVVLSVDLLPGGGKGKAKVVSDDTRDDALLGCLVELWESYEWPDAFGDIEQIRLPPFEFVAPQAQYTVASAHAQVFVLEDKKSQAWIVLDEVNTGNADAALSLLVMEDGLNISMHRHESAEVVFILSGEGTVYGLDGQNKGTRVSRGSAIYIPAKTAHAFTHTGTEPVTALQFYAPGGAEQRFKDGLAHGTTPVDKKELARPPRKAPRPRVRQSQKVDALTIGGGKGRVKILWDEKLAGDGAAYIGYFEADAGMSVPKHQHDSSSEYLYILDGEGELYVGDEATTVQAGDAIQIPRGVEHSFVAGAETVKAIQFYTPSGPEQRFKPKP